GGAPGGGRGAAAGRGGPGAGGPGAAAAGRGGPGAGGLGAGGPGRGAAAGPRGAGPGAGAGRGAAPQPATFAIAPGGGRIRGTPAPSGPPVILSRNGKEFEANGETNVRAVTQYKVTTERPNLSINVKELDEGSW